VIKLKWIGSCIPLRMGNTTEKVHQPLAMVQPLQTSSLWMTTVCIQISLRVTLPHLCVTVNRNRQELVKAYRGTAHDPPKVWSSVTAVIPTSPEITATNQTRAWISPQPMIEWAHRQTQRQLVTESRNRDNTRKCHDIANFKVVKPFSKVCGSAPANYTRVQNIAYIECKTELQQPQCLSKSQTSLQKCIIWSHLPPFYQNSIKFIRAALLSWHYTSWWSPRRVTVNLDSCTDISMIAQH